MKVVRNESKVQLYNYQGWMEFQKTEEKDFQNDEGITSNEIDGRNCHQRNHREETV